MGTSCGETPDAVVFVLILWDDVGLLPNNCEHNKATVSYALIRLKEIAQLTGSLLW